ncbi:MAG: biotin/lipoyl-binding protein [Lachnospiraceae bacterium]|nr:biotin/lipoyl-binding protein [Lachnospiraceae bacterium]
MDRKKVFGIFGGFLAVMLVFTILSRAVSGASMARVETVKAKGGIIEHRVSGSGKIEAGKEIAVYTENGQRVKEICVEEGQKVEKGDLLFTVDLEELEEQILALQQELEKEKLQNQDLQSAGNLEQKTWETNRNRAAEDYNAAVADGEKAVIQAKAEWDRAEQELHAFLQSQSDHLSTDQMQRVNPDLANGTQEAPDGDSNAEEGQKNSADGDNREGSQDQNKEEKDQNQNQGQTPEQETNAAQEKAEWEAQKAQLEQAAAEAKAAYEAALSARAENVKATARALEDASRQPASDSTLKQNEITRQQQELALNKLQSLKKIEGKITAPVQGIVTQIAITTGDFTTEGTAIRLADTSQGNRLTAVVDKSNEKYLSKGSPVNISVSGKKEEISDYTVTNVTENEEDPNLLDVVIDLPPGVLEAGMMADIEVVQKSEEYSTVIPVQALHEEQSGTFILVVQEEQGVMGTELAVKRLEVNVLDKNSAYAALEEGLLSGDQEIISSSSRVIEDGSRVRKKET